MVYLNGENEENDLVTSHTNDGMKQDRMRRKCLKVMVGDGT